MNTFSVESLLRCKWVAPVPGCSYSSTVRFRLGIGTARFKTKVFGCSAVVGVREASVISVVPVLLRVCGSYQVLLWRSAGVSRRRAWLSVWVILSLLLMWGHGGLFSSLI